MAIGTTLKISFDGTEVKRGLANMKAGLATAAKSAGIAGAAVVGIGVALIAAAKKAIDLGLAINKMGEEAANSEQLVTHVAKTIGVFGAESGKVADRLNDMADANGRMLGVDQKVIKTTIAKLLTFKKLASTANMVGGAFDRSTMLALDMAELGFGTAESNAVQLGKALEDPIKGLASLRRSGITFTAAEQDKIKALTQSNKLLEAQSLILAAIEGQLGGAALAGADASKQVAVGIQQMKESFAMGFASAFTDAGADMEPFFQSIMQPLENLGTRLGDALRASFAGNASDLTNIGMAIGNMLGSAMKKGVKNAFISGGSGIIDMIPDWSAVGKGIEVTERVTGYNIKKESSKAASEVLRRDMEDIMNELRINLAQFSDPSRNPNRIVRDGVANSANRARTGIQTETGNFPANSKEWISYLKRIADNTQPAGM